MTQSGEPVIRVADLKKHYGDVKAVDGVTFEVARGEVFGMLGPNGAGKTTTIEVLEGRRPPDSGTVEVLGLDVRRHPQSIKQRIGVQLQSVSLYPRLTVTELLDLFGSFFSHRVPTKQLIDAVDLGERARAWSMNLSGGQQQRLSIALALVNDPELCNRVAIMDHGHILEMGAVSELIGRRFRERAVFFDSNPKLPAGQLGALGGVTRTAQEDGQTVLYSNDVPGTIAALLATADGLSVEPHNLGIRQATLEDVFLDLTGRALRD